MASHGTDQLIVQRLLSAKNLRDGQKAIIGSGIVVFIQFALFLFIGLGLWAFYQGRLFPATDQIFPTFIIDRMPPGLVGLIIAAVVAATMSTHSGAINSLAAATTHDIYLPLTKRAADAPETLKMGKLFALIWGTVLTLGALLFPQESNTPVVVVALGIASFTYGGLLGGFFLGVFWARANQRDAIIGMSVGIAAMSFVVFARQLGSWFPVLADPLAPFASIAWPWYVLIGTSITMTTGILSSLTHPSPAPVAQPSGASLVSAIVIGVDGGGSRTRVLVADEQGREIVSVEGAGSAVKPGEAERSADVIAALIRDALASSDMNHVTPKVVCVGVAGVGRDPERQALWQALASRDIAEEVVVHADATVALDDAFGEGPGVLLIAGTGSGRLWTRSHRYVRALRRLGSVLWRRRQRRVDRTEGAERRHRRRGWTRTGNDVDWRDPHLPPR
jgi:hypothetical protein